MWYEDGAVGGRQGQGRGFCGRKGWSVGVDRASSGSFALERRAQDDSKNKQRQEQATADGMKGSTLGDLREIRRKIFRFMRLP